MPYILPDPEAMREKLTSKLSEEDLARIQEERDRLQRQFDEARAARLQQQQRAAERAG